MASRLFRSFGSGTVSTRTSFLPCQQIAFICSFVPVSGYRRAHRSPGKILRKPLPLFRICSAEPVHLRRPSIPWAGPPWWAPHRLPAGFADASDRCGSVKMALRRKASPRTRLPLRPEDCIAKPRELRFRGPPAASLNVTDPAFATSDPSSDRQPINWPGISLIISASHSIRRPPGPLATQWDLSVRAVHPHRLHVFHEFGQIFQVAPETSKLHGAGD